MRKGLGISRGIAIGKAFVYENTPIAYGGLSIAPNDVPREAVVLAEDILPSDTFTMDKSKVLGFVTLLGSKTSHVAIIASMMGIPAVAGVCTGDVENDVLVIVDGSEGEVIINPSQPEIEIYSNRSMIRI